MKLRVKKITPPEEKYNYCDCPYISESGRGRNILTTMVCRNPYSLPCGFYPKEKARRKTIEAE